MMTLTFLFKPVSINKLRSWWSWRVLVNFIKTVYLHVRSV